jgi:hypothetical protein
VGASYHLPHVLVHRVGNIPGVRTHAHCMPGGEDLDQLLLPHGAVPAQRALQLLNMGQQLFAKRYGCHCLLL